MRPREDPTMSTPSKLTGLLALTALLFTSHDADAQHRLAPYVSELTASAPEPGDLAGGSTSPIAPRQTAASDNSTASAIVMASLGSAAGLLVGALVALGTSQPNDNWSAPILGAGIGSFLGAGLGGAAASGQPGRAFVGSALGMAAGGLFAEVVARPVFDGDGTAVLWGYSITHGLVTGLVSAFGG